MKRKEEALQDNLKLKGFFRLNIMENGKVVGDSGWVENQITDYGVLNYLMIPLTGGTAKAVTHMGIGTGTNPASNATILDGEIALRQAITTSTIASRTAQFTCQFASSVYSAAAYSLPKTIQNLGLYNTSATASSTLFAGKTFTTSQWASNQDVNASYQIQIASA